MVFNTDFITDGSCNTRHVCEVCNTFTAIGDPHVHTFHHAIGTQYTCNSMGCYLRLFAEPYHYAYFRAQRNFEEAQDDMRSLEETISGLNSDISTLEGKLEDADRHAEEIESTIGQLRRTL